MDLFKKKKKIKSMNNKMAKNTYLSIDSKKQTKHTRRTKTVDTESLLMVTGWEGCVGNG